MATKDQKFRALEEAIKIAKEHARGGSEKVTPDYVIEESYKTIVKLMDEVESDKS